MKRSIVIAIMVALSLVFSSIAIAETLEKIPLTYSDHSPPTAGGNLFLKQQWLPKVQKELVKSGYELDITFYHAQSLYKLTDQVQALEDGLIDITIFAPTFNLSRAPLHEFISMPMMGMSAKAADRIWWELQDKFPEVGKAFEPYFELYHFVALPRVMNANENLRVPEDFRGKRILASGIFAKLMRSVKAVPLRQSPSDWYTSLERGLADAVGVGIVGTTMYHLDDVTKFHIFPKGDNFGYIGTSIVMNKNKYNSLPAPVQKVLKENQLWGSLYMTKFEENNIQNSLKIVKDKGHTVTYLTDSEMEKWYEAAKPIHEKWIKKMEKKGLPGRDVYNEVVRLAKQYQDL